jgi:hypothetical protein
LDAATGVGSPSAGIKSEVALLSAMLVVKIKKVISRNPRSTIGVISICGAHNRWGFLCGLLVSILFMLLRFITPMMKIRE